MAGSHGAWGLVRHGAYPRGLEAAGPAHSAILVHGVLPAALRLGPDERRRLPTALVRGVLPAVMPSGTRMVGRGRSAVTVHRVLSATPRVGVVWTRQHRPVLVHGVLLAAVGGSPAQRLRQPIVLAPGVWPAVTPTGMRSGRHTASVFTVFSALPPC
jgi:hypothetical protein